jgi:hypothetical protein
MRVQQDWPLKVRISPYSWCFMLKNPYTKPGIRRNIPANTLAGLMVG